MHIIPTIKKLYIIINILFILLFLISFLEIAINSINKGYVYSTFNIIKLFLNLAWLYKVTGI